MRQVFLCSTNEDVKLERALAIEILNSLHSAGAPKLLYYEDFIKMSLVDKAINACLTHAKKANEAILILRHRPGSPCLFNHTDECFKEHIKSIQEYIGKNSPHSWKILPTNRRLPPITWVELFIIHSKTSSPGHCNILAFIDKELVKMAHKYKSKTPLNTKHKLISFFNDHDEQFRDLNLKGTGGKISKNDWIWRLIWLCEFVNWIYHENIRVIELGRDIDGISALTNGIKENYAAYNKAKGSLWVEDNVEISNVISSIENEFTGEVWVWNSDLSYLTDEDKFKQIYKPHISPTKEVKIVASKPRWNRLVQTKKINNIRKNLNDLDEENKNKIHIKLVSDTKFKENLTTTIFGINDSDFAKSIMLVRPIIIPDHKENNRPFSNFVFPNSTPHRSLIKCVCDRLENEFKPPKKFKPLYQMVQ